ncbi:patatin-like phospholipase family protein [Shewanella eurypsychrophilus]|uniref:Patatin-like phospholipase family protein n=1 Tax=Shewanella eurypsychrophilus TaxID=2593656 RepID=A0ABX8S2R1_9GAMM|nr:MULTISPECIES: patatin-like phospholipase family protein [Shewanella]QXP44811.1 patatin-like phospholipase family protein [Shewanella eurypsychrophilus]
MPKVLANPIEDDSPLSLIDAETSPHLKVGLALSGGGAKGAAHVGVLRYLEANNIAIDYIAGTSIGAYVGGLYALGYSADDIEHIMLNLDWTSGFNDTVPRRALNHHDKQDTDRFNLPFEFGSIDGVILLPQGVLRGQTMANLYILSAGVVPNQNSFDDLAIPFKAIATDIATGEIVILDSGNLLTAMQASASVPGILQPVEINGQYLVDGGMVSNMPADTVRKMGADIVIAIDIGSDLAPKEELQDSFAILGQLSTMMTRANAVSQIDRLQPQDILIRPDISQLGTTDFNSMPLGFKEGELAAKAHKDQLFKLKSTAQHFSQYQAGRLAYKQALFTFQQQAIDVVSVINNTSTKTEKIVNTLAVKAGDSINARSLVDAIDRVYSLNTFERVNAEVVSTADEGKELLVTTKEKSWGPNFFDIGFSWEEDFSDISDLKLDLLYSMHNVADTGGQLRFELSSGRKKQLATEYRLPLDPLGHYYWKSRYQYSKEEQLYFWDNQGSLKTLIKSHKISTSLGINVTNDMIIELGISAETGDVIGPSILDLEIDYETYSSFAIMSYDTLDSYSFPSEGTRVYFKGGYNKDKLNQYTLPIIGDVFGDDSLFNYEFSLKHALSFEQHTFINKVEVSGTNSDNVSLIHTHKLGGFLNLSGLHKDALVGSQLVYGSLVYQYRIDWQGFGGMRMPIYLGSSVEAGNVWQYKSERCLDDLIYAASIFVGVESEFGPAVLGFGMNDLHHKTFYLTIGKTF